VPIRIIFGVLYNIFNLVQCETTQALTRDNMEEKRELIKAIPKDRIISEIPKLKQVSNNLLPPKFVICIHSYKSN
jgi:hypothetical protein